MTQNSHKSGPVAGQLDRLKSEAAGFLDAIGDKAMSSLKDTVEGATDRLTDYTKASAAPSVKAVAAGAKSLAEGKSPVRSLVSGGTSAAKEKIANITGRSGGGKNMKITNIVESIDVGVPVKLAYDQWTRFTDFPSFMKKVESVDQPADEKLTWKANVLWSHRTWESTILEQAPEDKIVWRSKGAKGYVDGAVTFHELAPNLTRILVVLEYHPQGFFERTGNLWRAQGRRVRLELKHFRRYVMTEAVLHSDEIEGWRGTISDGQVRQKGGSKSKGNDQGARTGRGATSANNRSTGRARSGRQASASTSSGSRPTRSQAGTRQGNGRKGSASRASTGSGPAARGGSRRSAGSSKQSAKSQKAS